MSENTQKDMEQNVQEETVKEVPVTEAVKEEKKETPSKEKKGFMKKDPKKEKIAQLENKKVLLMFSTLPTILTLLKHFFWT